MATMLICRGPAIPIGEMRCWMAGVSLNGTERLASSSPMTTSVSDEREGERGREEEREREGEREGEGKRERERERERGKEKRGKGRGRERSSRPLLLMSKVRNVCVRQPVFRTT